METSYRQQLFQLVREEWQSLPAQCRPWGVWINLHQPLSAEVHSPLLSPLTLRRAWFLEERRSEPQERSVWAFTRFWLMHFERSWDTTDLASRDPRFAARCYPLGMAAFAPYVDSTDIYLETLWGGLWGLGRRLTVNAEGLLEPLRGLWIA